MARERADARQGRTREESRVTTMRKIGFLMSLGILTVASAAMAGSTSGQTVTYNSSTEAVGVVRDARYSSDTVEFIGCSVQSNGLVACYVKDAAGTYKNCTTTAAGFATAAAAIGANSQLTIRWDASANCTLLNVYNTSIYLD
jgi:hypothetical protein